MTKFQTLVQYSLAAVLLASEFFSTGAPPQGDDKVVYFTTIFFSPDKTRAAECTRSTYMILKKKFKDVHLIIKRMELGLSLPAPKSTIDFIL